MKLQLMWILDNEEYKHIVKWNDDGLTFLIVDMEALTTKMYPAFFGKKEIEPESFQRRVRLSDDSLLTLLVMTILLWKKLLYGYSPLIHCRLLL